MAQFLRHAANVAHAGGAAGALEILQWFRLALGIGIGEVQLRIVHRTLLKAQFWKGNLGLDICLNHLAPLLTTALGLLFLHDNVILLATQFFAQLRNDAVHLGDAAFVCLTDHLQPLVTYLPLCVALRELSFSLLKALGKFAHPVLQLLHRQLLNLWMNRKERG